MPNARRIDGFVLFRCISCEGFVLCCEPRAGALIKAKASAGPVEALQEPEAGEELPSGYAAAGVARATAAAPFPYRPLCRAAGARRLCERALLAPRSGFAARALMALPALQSRP